MVILGKTNTLRIVKEVTFGLYLDGGDDYGEILLPSRYVPAGATIDSLIDVFVYRDSEDIVIATTEKPLTEIDRCAFLKVVDLNDAGAFVDWGLTKDLFIPLREQQTPMTTGQSHVIYVFEDATGRIAGSSKLSFFLDEDGTGFLPGQDVDLLVATRSDLGFKAVINDTHLGLIHHADVMGLLAAGERIRGYIKKVRHDGAIDLMLQPAATRNSKASLAEQILSDLDSAGGSLSLTDKSRPEDIFTRYKVSKGRFKEALGQLYKARKIVILDDKITRT